MRAFKRFFGVAPERFRSGFAIASLEAQSPMSESPDRGVYLVHLPGVVTVSAFHVAGSSRRFDAASKAQIPQLGPCRSAACPSRVRC